MKRLLLIGAGFMGLRYLDAATDLGLRVSVVESESWAGSLSEGSEVYRIGDLDEAGWAIDEIWAVGGYAAAADGGADGVLAFSEPHVLSAAIVADRLGLPGPSLHASVLSRNKALQRACFAAAGLPQPKFEVVSNHDRALEWAAPHLPVVVKPFSRFGSNGVELVSDLDTLRAVLERRRSEQLLVEQAVEGPEYSWEGFIADGRVLFGNVTAKETTGPPFFVELSHRAGHRFDDPGTDSEVRTLAADVVRSAGIRTGLVHLEFRMTAQGPSIMEVAVRTPGDFIFELIATTYRFNPYLAAVQLAMGIDPTLPATDAPRSFPAAWFPVCQPGTVAEISGLKEVFAHPMVSQAGVTVHIGDVVKPVRSSAQRAGYVLIDAPSPQERDQTVKTVQELLRITTEPVDV
ncbi:MAG TPA: ATP-grasp domain-containing protein [Streptosporangiaceae bacterium]|nr:ATP-grasp domain-containing protein [Streptosporangiaceae bacterium]